MDKFFIYGCINKKMTVTCRCIGTDKDTQLHNQESCGVCTQKCIDGGYGNTAECVDTGLFGIIVVVLFIISIVFWAMMIWFSIHVMKKCKGKPKWLNPVIITLLVLWLLMGWFPPLGLTFFIILLTILIVFNNKKR
jgi:hypothetical protein